MSNKIFTELELRQLEGNPNVRHVCEKAITYEPSFKNIHPEAMIHSDQGIHYTHP